MRVSVLKGANMLTICAADEAIWHFAGLFQIADERARMRIDYEPLTPIRPEVDPGTIKLQDPANPFPFRLPDFQPEVAYASPGAPIGVPAPADIVLMTSPAELPLTSPFFGGQGVAASLPVGARPMPVSVEPPGDHPVWVVPVPGSIAAIIIQQGRLADDDRIDPDEMIGGTVAQELIMQRLQELAQQAQALGVGLDVALPADEAGFPEMAQAFQKAAAPANVSDDAQLFTAAGQAAVGQYLNGEWVDERPDIEDYLPQYRQDRAEREEQDDGPLPNRDGPQAAAANTATVAPNDDPQHELIYGNNTLINEVAIKSAWMAAPVIVAGAGAYSYDIISQTNLISDLDAVAGTADQPSQGLNYASYAIFSNPAAIPEAQDSDGPQYWVTATVEGSLIGFNWVDQYNLVTDNEVTKVTLQGEKTLMLMGDNAALNQVSLAELGMQFDLIVVDGHVINLNAILQGNVLLDDDRIMVDGTAATIRSGDNLLVNDATIAQTGQTSFVPVTTDHGLAQVSTVDGHLTLPDAVLGDPALDGLEFVRVLQIKGDLVSVNMVRQMNVLGDSDQIELYRDSLAASGGEVEVVSGANMLVNAATINEFGVDSTIYTGGEVYSDALLHQAELVSADAPLMPSPMPGLATEAVLFLADGILGDDVPEDEFRPIGTDSAIPSDAMETVLA